MECEALGRSPKAALRLGLATSQHCVTVIEEAAGRPIAMFGVMTLSLVGQVGVPWFLGTDDVFNYPRDLAWTGRAMIETWQTRFKVMRNVVAVENDKAIRLLRYWGATVGDEVEMHRGVAFVPFTFKRAIQGAARAA